jgi:hypothetical protein
MEPNYDNAVLRIASIRPPSAVTMLFTLVLLTELPGCFDVPATEAPDSSGSSGTGFASGSTSSGLSTMGDVDGSASVTSSPSSTSAPSPSSSETGAADDLGDSTSSTGSETSTGGPVEGDVTPPVVVYFSPAHGTQQVFEEVIHIVFSEPMDQATVGNAFPQGSGFAWNGAGNEVEFGHPFPFEDMPVVLDLEVPTSVTDLAGNPLAEPFVATIVLAAMQTVELEYVSGLTGSTQINGNTGTWFYGGDVGTNDVRFAGISFSTGVLPSFVDVLAVRSATFSSQVTRTDGNPNDLGLGGFFLDHVEFGGISEIDTATILDDDFVTLFAPGGIVLGAPVTVDVLPQLLASWTSGAEYFQLRFHPMVSDGDGGQDAVFLRRVGDENDSTVEAGVMDPDEAKRARVVIEYFPQ